MRLSRFHWTVLAAISLAALFAGCSERAAPVAAEAPAAAGGIAASPAAMSAPMATQARMKGVASAESTPADAPAAADARYIAYTHRYAIEAERARLRAVLDAHLARCKQIDCTVLSQSYTEENDNQPPSATLSVRVSHKDKDPFTDALKSGEGRVTNQASVAEDKTLQVVDIEARMANLTQLRDRLRKLLADPKAGIKEAVEIERQLAQTQGEIDSMTSQRRVLAQQTERELFEINYQARRSAIERSMFEPVKNALLGSGRVAMESVAGMITLLAATVVWLVPLAGVIWFIRRWRRRKRPSG